ncbi:DUF5801 repeats-in-toxin domain-containing protein, partial [Lactobacillus crispatus]|uniref:DUF5801 repeats-in-toxin domain-containing protein n=1 Tax=Lactobacillus crispatus TaxID=47770 RepID=UPI00197CA126
LAFTIAVDPNTGIVTFTEDRAVKQSLASNPDTGEGISLATGVVTLTASITDKDGDFQNASLDLGAKLTITDDGPSITVNAAGEPSLSLSDTHLTAATNIDNGSAPSLPQTSITGDFSAAFTTVQGADSATTTYV